MRADLFAELQAEIAAARAARGLTPKITNPNPPPRGTTRCDECGTDYKRVKGDTMTICYTCLPILD